MSKEMMRSIARAVGGRMKSVLAQVARQEASRFIRHLRDRVLAPAAPQTRETPTVLAPPAPLETRRADPLEAPALSVTAPEPKQPVAAPTPPRRAAAKRAVSADTISSVDINTASRAELVRLPGIGPARADAILSGRPYQGPGDLVEKRILPSSVFEGLKDQIRAG